MAALVFMESRTWLAAGWLMLHFLWVGGAIGLVAIGGRRLLRPANAKQRYAFALGCLLALATAPVLIALFLVPATPVASANERASTEAPSLSFPANNLPNTIGPPAIPVMAPEATITERIEAAPASTVSNRIKASVLTRIAFYLPWVWLIGAPITFLLVGTGLIGAERLRRHSVLIQEGDLPSQCRRLGIALGIIRHVGVGVCERLAGPILIGILRPVILLPPAALTGWSVAQLEMVLVHELAHVRRWDSLVNLLQRIVEALLFFHPAVWWVSAWIRLEREMCCDQVVVAHTGKPVAYAQTLAALALPNLPMNPVLAMAESNLVPRIRRILNLEDRSMKVSPRVLGLSAALIVGVGVILGLCAQEADPKSVQPDGGKTASGLDYQETSKDPIPAQKEKEKTQKNQGSPPGNYLPKYGLSKISRLL
jgi:beta-lactamase regulating signal transducer with metallopeptidase domain